MRVNLAIGGVVLGVLTPCVMAQMVPVLQERTVQTQASVSSGASAGDFDEAPNFGPFVRDLTSSVSGAGGAGADALAGQNSLLSSGLVSGALSASVGVRTGTTFVTGEAESHSDLLFIFDLAEPTQIQFSAAVELALIGRNPDGEPSDLYGVARVRLLDSNTLDVIAGVELGVTSDSATDSLLYAATLPAGQYVILASAQAHAFSADLLGPPPRSGSGEATTTFSLTVVPAPAGVALGGVSLLALRRRR